MVSQNTDNHETAFTVSIDHVSTATGISAQERSVTAMKCADPASAPEDFRRPGHMFPLLARKNGVLERAGHTEATVDLLRLAGLKTCGLCCEIMEEDGTMMRTPRLMEMAEAWNMPIITIKDLIAYRKCHEKLVDRVTVTRMPTREMYLVLCAATADSSWPEPWKRLMPREEEFFSICVRKAGASD